MKKQPEKYSNKIEYWIKKGYDEETAKEKLSDRQRTYGKRIDGKNYEYRIRTKNTSRMLDFYIPKIEKVIEFDGTYWHGEIGRGIEYGTWREI